MDQIRLLLLNTGWTCDELIKNVQEYKLKVDENTNEFNNLTTAISDHSESISDNFDETNSHRRISFVEVENDHSYTSRKASIGDCKSQTKVDRSRIRNHNEEYIKKYFKRKNRRYMKRINFPRILKNRYRLQRKYSVTDRKMLICKYKSHEFVRNEITHQLELLRSKKAFGISADIRQPVITRQIVSKKRYSGSKNKDEGCCSKDGLVYEEACDINTSNYVPENPPFPEVLLENVNRIELETNKEDACYIKPSKTNDITKIKGWKRKFTTLYKNKFSPSEELLSKSQEVSNENGILENKVQPEIRTDIKSAFASTNLDGFLHDSANLHISFEIPTLDSGNNESSTTVNNRQTESQSVQNIASTSISPQTNGEDELLKIAKIDTLNLYRPRTLGQKRRIWKLKADNRLKRKIEDVAKPRTLAEKRRMMDNDTDIKTKPKVETNNGGGSIAKYSYILHRGKKLRIPTRTENGIIAYIKSHYGKRDYIYVPRKIRQNKMKPSIFATIPTTPPQVVKYRPGPLSKKTILQEYNKEWKTEIKQLPKIYLQVTPQLNKPIAPYIRHLLPQYDFELTHERISFALTALNFKDQSRSFTFPLSYANKQECLLLRRRINPSEDVAPEIVKTEDSKSVEETVQNVIDKMLDYVEIKSISEEVLRDDVTEMIMREEKTNIGEQQNNVAKKRKTKQSKTNYELKRLNVKVIEVNLEEKEKESDDCKKPFCRLGCLCKSLSTTSSLVSNHCGIPDCMFECKCNYEKKSKGNLKVTLPIGTDLLSEGAVNRLEVEAKKNLARVEKEFTQTVIQANNQTIVVGGCTNRQRRVTKLPKKYNDYIDDSDANNEPVQAELDESDETRQEDMKLRQWKPVACTVLMSKLNLDQVIPYCMVHNLYDCYCEFKSLYETREEKQKEDKEKKPVDETVNLKLSSDKAYDIWFKDGSFNYDILEWDSCARTKGLPTDYYHIRNKSEKFIKTRRRRLDKMYKYNHSTHQYINCGIDTEDNTIRVIDEPQPCIDEHITNSTSNNTNVISNEKRTRRKQSLLIRRDISPIAHPKILESSENAIQRRKKQRKYLSSILDRPILPKDADQRDEYEKKCNKYEEQMKRLDLEQRIAKFEQIFQTMRTPSTANLFTPSSLIQEKLTEILGKHIGGDVQFRLIPWEILVKKYESSSLQLWHSTYFKKPRIIATDNNTIPKHFVNVRNYENISNKDKIKADVIRWLVTKQVPANNSKENIFVIVQLTKTHCELCGLWEKKQNNQSDKMVLISQPYTENRMYSIVKKIMFSKCKFAKQMLFDPNVSDDAQKIPAVSAFLPQISSNSKWRMIKLNSDFSVLSLHRNKYAIKYSDLQKVMKMAKETGFTIVLKTSEVETNYPHPDFGMYASPDCDDIIFIGPYYHNEDHDITTLRYANRELIRTEVFCKMRGQKPVCSGVWLYQLSMTPSSVDNLHTIDLTECESDHESRKRREISESGTITSNNPESLLICEKQEMRSSKKKRKSKNTPLISSTDLLKYESYADDYNVLPIFYMFMPEEAGTNNFGAESKIYFVPNVPKMGYIVGYRKPDHVIIYWPSLKYVVNFPNVSEAIMYIQRELNSCFIKSPSFQIFVDVEFNVESTAIQIFNWDLLKGYYIVCPSGVIPLLELTKSTLKLLNLTLGEVETLAKTVAQRKIFDKCYELARKLFVPSKVGNPKNTSEILDMIMTEIKHQEAIEHKLLICQSKLTDKRQSLRLKCTAVIKELQPLVNEKMQRAMQKILSFNKVLVDEKSTKSNGNDVICLDGDSEEDNSKDNCATNVEEQVLSTSITSITSSPSMPKISVKKIQDLKEPNSGTSTAQSSSKTLSVKSFSILKNKAHSNETSSSSVNSVSVNSDSSVTLTQSDTSLIMRPPDHSVNTSNCKTFTIKRSILNKKCSKFVIKTSNGKYMTIRAEDLKELPVKKLQPIAPNDPVISKLSMSTKRILMPAKTNGFLKVNLNDKPSFSDCKVVSTNLVDIGQAGSLQCTSTSTSTSLSILPTSTSTVSLSLLPSKQT